jgi:predicted TIM-barrel fold metal-dependent hydrolase
MYQEGMGRRQFLANGAKLAMATSLLTQQSRAADADQPAKEPNEAATKGGGGRGPAFIIDSHVHCKSTDVWVKEMVETYRPRNAMACVFTYMEDMKLVKDAMAGYPDVFIGYGRVHLDNPDAIREVETFKKNGFVGMKFHHPQKNFDDPSYFQVYRLCEEYKMHMIFHTGVTGRTPSDKPQWGSSARMRPVYLDEICLQCPRTTVQGAHLGNPWYNEAAETARWNANLYFDISGSTLIKFIKLGHLKRMSEILWWADDESKNNPHTLKGGPSGWEHIVFGSDEGPSGLAANIERFQKMLDANNVSAATREKMWGLTMARILGIDPKTHKFIRAVS